jgi:hypothetical protein
MFYPNIWWYYATERFVPQYDEACCWETSQKDQYNIQSLQQIQNTTQYNIT